MPTDVLIGGLTFTIRVDNSYNEGRQIYASVSTIELRIRVRSIDVSAQQMQVAMFNELIHAINRVYGAAS